MGAFTGTPAGTAEYNLATGVTTGGIAYLEKLRARRFTYTHTLGAGTGEINLVLIPEGSITIFSELSRCSTSAMATGADLHLGYRAHVQPSGTAVAADDNAFMDNGDAATGITHAAWPLPAAPGLTHLNSRSGIVIYGMIDTGNIEDTDTIAGWVVWGGLS